MNDIKPATPTENIALAQAKSSAVATRSLPRWVLPAVGGAIFLAMAPLGYLSGLGLLTTLTSILFYVIVAQGWNLLGGYGGYLNFGAALFVGAGAYMAAWLNNSFGWPVWYTLIPGALAAVVVSVIIGYATLRLRSHYFAIFTLILLFLALTIVKNTPALGGATGLFVRVGNDISSRDLAALFFYLMLGLSLIATVIAYAVEHSNFGYALRAISEDEPAAQVLGVKTVQVKLRALVIGAALGGTAGAAWAFLTGYIEPTGAFSVKIALDIVLVCVIGGLGSWLGPLIGSFIVVGLEQFLRVTLPGVDLFGFDLPNETNRLILGVILIIFALFIRRGIVGLLNRRRGRQISV
ncbi:branched-chain amino acid ABC transporter permease [Cryobacterium psychrophilum]|uniref:Branched-chain amino acid ABC transporter permease n=1 Tax=Cryobacterium psychrophilum TaxID=41988 RepID=A0A4Y8KQT4_9MICO|nr:branched-chain amino acid ABC transporter permease [Cryobacterium psychrophilum]TDW29511.1 amino acid/amide ABC transporter membrane protein 2 (HAAT family) [Cryobacterium psychrophilum]TFD81645.1 branched-chain amino acid ABC transporter permease [Cryobacterium psychrophilum]